MILIAYGISTEIVLVTMMLYCIKIQDLTLVHPGLDYVLRTSVDKHLNLGFTLR